MMDDQQHSGYTLFTSFEHLIYIINKRLEDFFEDLEDVISLIQDGDVEAIKKLPQSLIREYVGMH